MREENKLKETKECYDNRLQVFSEIIENQELLIKASQK